jgi:hypothetical protein
MDSRLRGNDDDGCCTSPFPVIPEWPQAISGIHVSSGNLMVRHAHHESQKNLILSLSKDVFVPLDKWIPGSGSAGPGMTRV